MEILRTPRLLLREFTAADADFVLALVNDPDWHRFINDPGVRTTGQARVWMQERLFEPYQRLGHGFWAVQALDDGRLLGLCGLFKRDSLPEVDLGYGFVPAARGHGFAREAAAACLQHARQVLGLRRVLAITAPENLTSIALLLSLGMREESTEGLTIHGTSRLFAWSADPSLPGESPLAHNHTDGDQARGRA